VIGITSQDLEPSVANLRLYSERCTAPVRSSLNLKRFIIKKQPGPGQFRNCIVNGLLDERRSIRSGEESPSTSAGSDGVTKAQKNSR
jgi:hypothetical protein